MDEGDAMASTPQQAQTAQKDILQSSQNAVPAMAVTSVLSMLQGWVAVRKGIQCHGFHCLSASHVATIVLLGRLLLRQS